MSFARRLRPRPAHSAMSPAQNAAKMLLAQLGEILNSEIRIEDIPKDYKEYLEKEYGKDEDPQFYEDAAYDKYWPLSISRSDNTSSLIYEMREDELFCKNHKKAFDEIDKEADLKARDLMLSEICWDYIQEKHYSTNLLIPKEAFEKDRLDRMINQLRGIANGAITTGSAELGKDVSDFVKVLRHTVSSNEESPALHERMGPIWHHYSNFTYELMEALEVAQRTPIFMDAPLRESHAPSR